MTTSECTTNPPLKQCTNKEICTHPLGCWQPETTEYFRASKGGKNGLRSRCRHCDRDASRCYVQNHRAERIEYAHTHREQARSAERRYRERHPERVKESSRNHMRKFRALNPDLSRRRTREWAAAHKEQISANKRDYSIRNPEVAVRARAKRYARVHQAPGTYTLKDVLLHLKTQHEKCWWCGKKLNPKKYHVDHRVPLSRGGSNAPENLCISCPKCNQSKKDKLPYEWNGRLL